MPKFGYILKLHEKSFTKVILNLVDSYPDSVLRLFKLGRYHEFFFNVFYILLLFFRVYYDVLHLSCVDSFWSEVVKEPFG